MPTQPPHTPTDERLRVEQMFHDEQAAERSREFDSGRADLRFADEDFLDHETWIRPAVAALGILQDRDVLDYGCGHGMAAVVLARAGARVTALDLSPGYVAEAEARAAANGVAVRCLVANAERLPFPAASFDAIWGNAILHHLDLPAAAAELHRVLRPGGSAVFCEPWGGNPLLNFARRRLPYPGKERTPDEQPLSQRDLRVIQTVFPQLEYHGYQLLGMLRRVCRNSILRVASDYADCIALAVCPMLKNWCRYVVIHLTKV